MGYRLLTADSIKVIVYSLLFIDSLEYIRVIRPSFSLSFVFFRVFRCSLEPSFSLPNPSNTCDTWHNKVDSLELKVYWLLVIGY